MCGRYALSLRPSEVRSALEATRMPVAEAPGDDETKQTYNFAPSYHGLVYRADGPEHGGQVDGKEEEAAGANAEGATGEPKYKLQSMQWGLVPFWTKRPEPYASKLKTINCRSEGLVDDTGMWTTMKKTKRCIVIAQGFYEWLKKGNDKLPHFTKRRDGQMMLFAGLFDMVQYEDSNEKIYTYTILTTDSNKQLGFLHDRMPVILDNGSDAIRTWLDPTRTEWSKDLQSLLEPYDGELECYQVSKDVGKVGNNSPSFLVPIDSAENKNNIANFFGTQKKAAKTEAVVGSVRKVEGDLNASRMEDGNVKVEHGVNEVRATTNRVEGTEDNAPLPVPVTPGSRSSELPRGIKREHSEAEETSGTADAGPPQKTPKSAAFASPVKRSTASSKKTPAKKQGTRSATSNGSAAKTSKADGSQKITSFFSK